MASSEGETTLGRVTKKEMYGIVGTPTDPLKALVPTFTEMLIQGVIESLKQGANNVSLDLRSQGEKAQHLAVKIEKLEAGIVLKVAVEGDWQTVPEIPIGLPISAGFDGKFFRFARAGDSDPIAEVGQILGPNGAYGLATRGKSDLWFLRLSAQVFPNGGKITAFVQPNGADVTAKESTLLYVDPQG